MFWKLILISCLFFIGSEAWLMRASYKNNAHPGKCYVNANLIISPGQKAKSPEGCSEIHCGDAQGNAEVVGCSKIAPPPNCRWNGYENENAPYPVCCVEKFVCDNPADRIEAENLQNSLKNMFQRQLDEDKTSH